jgi:hypothetical protein
MTRCIWDPSTPLLLSVFSWHSQLLARVSGLESMAEASLPDGLVDLTWTRIVYATYKEGAYQDLRISFECPARVGRHGWEPACSMVVASSWRGYTGVILWLQLQPATQYVDDCAFNVSLKPHRSLKKECHSIPDAAASTQSLSSERRAHVYRRTSTRLPHMDDT